MKDIRKHLELARRRNYGRQIRDAWLSELSRACAANITDEALLALEATEHLKNGFFARMLSGPVRKVYWPGDQVAQVLEKLEVITEQASDLDAILFSHVDKNIGAVKVKASSVLRHPFEVWGVVREDLCLTTLGLESGLCLELNEYGRERTEYELTTWGIFDTFD